MALHAEPRPLPPRVRRVRVGLSDLQRRRLKTRTIGFLIFYAIGAFGAVALTATRFTNETIVVLSLLIPCGILLLMPLTRHVLMAQQRRSMARAGLICAECYYSMRGLDETVPNCPECGAPRLHLLPRISPAGSERRQ